MPLFALMGTDGPRGLELRKLHRAAHLENLDTLAGQGRVRFGGPLLDAEGRPCGSLVLFEAPDLASARAVAESDPYVIEGVFEHFELRETRAVFPRSED
jgi:uncharacterized protein YciI